MNTIRFVRRSAARVSVVAATSFAFVAISAAPRTAAAQAVPLPVVTVKQVGTTDITLTWTPVPGASRYVVNRWSGALTGTPVIDLPTVPTLKVTGLNPGTAYYFTVRGTINGSNQVGPATLKVVTASAPPAASTTPPVASSAPPAATAAPPAAPLLAAPRIYAEIVTGSADIKLSWIKMTSAAVTDFKIETSTDATVPAGVASTTTKTVKLADAKTTAQNGYQWTEVLVPTLSQGGQNYFRVTPLIGATPQLPASIVSVNGLLPPPTNIKTTASKLAANGTGTITLAWPAVPNAKRYFVYKYTSASFTSRDPQGIVVTGTSYTTPAFPSKYRVYYRVSTYGSYEGAQSAGVEAQVP